MKTGRDYQPFIKYRPVGCAILLVFIISLLLICNWRDYNQEVKFRTRSEISENKQIKIWWEFSSTFFVLKGQDQAPPNNVRVDYENITIIPAQKPVIVAQTQIGDDMFFLVLRAEIAE